MSLKKQMKKLKKQQKKLAEAIRQEQATCPHFSKSGKSWLEPFQENNITKARCRECGEVVIADKQLMDDESVSISTEVVKTALAELRAQVRLGKIKLDEQTMRMITTFDAEVLRELPELISQIRQTNDRKKDKKKKKKDKKKENKRRRWK